MSVLIATRKGITEINKPTYLIKFPPGCYYRNIEQWYYHRTGGFGRNGSDLVNEVPNEIKLLMLIGGYS